jgi:hypothetical protein
MKFKDLMEATMGDPKEILDKALKKLRIDVSKFQWNNRRHYYYQEVKGRVDRGGPAKVLYDFFYKESKKLPLDNGSSEWHNSYKGKVDEKNYIDMTLRWTGNEISCEILLSPYAPYKATYDPYKWQ